MLKTEVCRPKYRCHSRKWEKRERKWALNSYSLPSAKPPSPQITIASELDGIGHFILSHACTRAYVTRILHFLLSQVSHFEHNFFCLNGMNYSLPSFFLFLCGGTIISLRRLLLFAVLFWFLLVLNNSLPSFQSFRHHFLVVTSSLFSSLPIVTFFCFFGLLILNRRVVLLKTTGCLT